MVQDAIEALLRQKLGLDANSIGSRMITRAVEQRRAACDLSDRTAYLMLLQTSPKELNQLIEAVVVPETWFFRDREPFVYLQQYVRDQWRSSDRILRVLSVPCSTGEEPYSIAMTLLDAGLTAGQFHIDAVDVSQKALDKAQRGIYRKSSFRGTDPQHIRRYFQAVNDEFEVRSIVRESVNFTRGNILEPHFLTNQKYHVIFCRNLMIYLDQTARDRVVQTLDRALLPTGILFLGSVETSQISNKLYRSIDHSFAFAYQKEPLILAAEPALPAPAPPAKPLRPSPSLNRPVAPEPSVPLLETAKQLADRGELAQAAQLCESAVRADPAQAPAYLLLGEIYQGLNQSQQAERCFQKAIYLNPDAYEALIHLALLKEQQGDRSAAERLKKRAQRLVDRLN